MSSKQIADFTWSVHSSKRLKYVPFEGISKSKGKSFILQKRHLRECPSQYTSQTVVASLS
jgi:hypothetical protein